jgi:cystathionine beta-synthase
MARRLVREEGIFAGGSSGSAVVGALRYARHHQLGPEAVMVVILPDSGSRYLSKVFNDDWMRENGFLEQSWMDVRASDILARKGDGRIFSAHPTDRMRDVVARLKEHDVSQLPVVDDDGRLQGIVTEIDLLNHMLLADHQHDAEETIETILDHNVPVVGPNSRLETLMAMFSNRAAVVIASNDRVVGILTKIDILDYLSSQVR